jgi:hypothetical protein
MIKRITFLLIVAASFLSPVIASAAAPPLQLSGEASISLLTCSPGDELYSVFGHSAIRVKDPLQDLDWVFNYGTFDFSDPDFYVNFVRGRLNYILSVAEYRHFEYEYRMDNRWIWEQELNITQDEKSFLFDSLLINYRPENRYYLYDFFFDNCATRIRDIFTEGLERELLFDYQQLEQGQSFRELLMPYLTEKPWARLGINLALGLPADKLATPWDYMFLPDHMMTVFGSARFNMEVENTLFAPNSEILLQGEDLPAASFRNAPFWVFLLVLLISVIISYGNLTSGRFYWWYDRILFGTTGFLGLLIAFLWFGTDHQVTVWNLNILWANPFHMIIIFFLREKYTRLLKYYFAANLLLLIILLFTWPLLPQVLPWVIIPLVLAMIVRSSVILRINKPALTLKALSDFQI